MTKHECGITSVCSCDLNAPNLRRLRSAAFNQDLAYYWASQCRVKSAVYDLVLDELLVFHTGEIFDHSGNLFDRLTSDTVGNDSLDKAFGLDPERTLRRYLSRSNGEFGNRLSSQLTEMVLLLHHGRRIRECRLSGSCSQCQ